jgi:hypothetical protein
MSFCSGRPARWSKNRYNWSSHHINIFPELFPTSGINLVFASRASRLITRLRASGTLIGLSTLDHHDGEADISSRGVLVAALTRVDSTSIGAVSIPGLEGVEVLSRAGCAGVPSGVNILLGFVVEKFSVVLSVVGGSGEGRGTDSEGRVGCESRSARDGNKGKDGLELLEQSIGERTNKSELVEGSFMTTKRNAMKRNATKTVKL